MIKTLRELILTGNLGRARVAHWWAVWHYEHAKSGVQLAADALRKAEVELIIHDNPPARTGEIPQYLFKREQ